MTTRTHSNDALTALFPIASDRSHPPRIEVEEALTSGEKARKYSTGRRVCPGGG